MRTTGTCGGRPRRKGGRDVGKKPPDDWSRPHWEPTGRPASVFYFVPGDPPAGLLELSRRRHHAAGVPEQLKATAHRRADNPRWFADFFARPGLGFGLEEAFGDRAPEVRAAERGLVVRGEFPDPPDLGYLRDTAGVVSALLDQGGGLGVLDLYAGRWWSRREWAERFVDRCGFAHKDFVRIVSTDDEAEHPGLWVHTRGMRKFGRPDLQVKHVPGPWPGDNPLVAAAGDVLNRLAEGLCRGAVVRNGGVLRFPGTRRRCTFRLTPDDIDSPACHFGNEVLEVVDLVGLKPQGDLNRLLGRLAAG